MMTPQFTIGTTLGTAGAFLFSQVGADSIASAPVWTQFGIIAAGLAVFQYQERKHTGLRRDADSARKADEARKDKRIEELEAEVRMLYERLAEEHRRREPPPG